ncbi:uncharacterized protein LOC113950081 [Corapipo altera]|uniref:uncharacterized protein LOC113950081 n=1 Tax=Corapipo altera TaxID=415028 RepID=UPI000FD6AA33|nr:uncharacterized protein LOC113950081 [Corapipo altera]
MHTVSTGALRVLLCVCAVPKGTGSSAPNTGFTVPVDAPSGVRSPSNRWIAFFFSLCTLHPTIPPPPHPITFFHGQNVLINLLLLFPDLTWWPTQSTTLTKRSLRDKTRLTSEEQGKCFRGRVQFLTWTPTRTGADPGRVEREEGLSLSLLNQVHFLPLKHRSAPVPKQMCQIAFKDLLFLRGVGWQIFEEERRARAREEKKFENALNYSLSRWLISIEARGHSGSFSMRFSFHLKLDGGAQLKAYQFVRLASCKPWSGSPKKPGLTIFPSGEGTAETSTPACLLCELALLPFKCQLL